MANRFSKVICWFVFVMVFVVAGCQRGYRKDVPAYEQVVDANLSIDPNLLIDPNFIVPDYASRAIEATGGRQAWMRTKKLTIESRATFYHLDDSFYLTEQEYEIHPWSNAIQISGEEPQGRFVCRFSGGAFSVLKGAERVDALPIAVLNRSFAEAILNITTAPVRFLDKSAEFTKELQPVKIMGQWYRPIRRTIRPASSEPGVPQLAKTKAVFYQNRDNSLIDLLWLGDVDGETFLTVRGYDYHEVEKNGVRLPAKIEIFITDASGASPRRLAKVDFD